MPGMREKVSGILRKMGHRPPWIGGKGRGLTEPQKILLRALGDGWEAEYPVPVNPRRDGLPTCYYLDLANPVMMVAIEVDGATHYLAEVKEADAKKTAFLNGRGWTVFRFWNREILRWKDSERPMEESISTTLRRSGIHLFRFTDY